MNCCRYEAILSLDVISTCGVDQFYRLKSFTHISTRKRVDSSDMARDMGPTGLTNVVT